MVLATAIMSNLRLETELNLKSCHPWQESKTAYGTAQKRNITPTSLKDGPRGIGSYYPVPEKLR